MRECIKRNKLLLILTIIFSIISSAAMVGLIIIYSNYYRLCYYWEHGWL